MLRIALSALVLVVAASVIFAADAVPSAANAPVVQPDKIPGNWKITPQPLPPLEEIVKRPAAAMPVYGLYTWAGEYRNLRESIRKVGWKSFRVGGPITDDDMKMFVEDGVEVMVTLQLIEAVTQGKRNRKDYQANEPFLADYLKSVDGFLTRYGPGGTFFKDNPTLPERPIRFIEVWNEPNFQYMIPDRQPRAEVEAEREALYARALPAVYQMVKKKWPTVQVLGFGAGGASAGDLRFIEHVLAKDPKEVRSFDILSTHPYVAPCPPEADNVQPWGGYSIARSLEAIRKMLAQGGAGGKPIWYTEMGWPISKADGGYFETKDKEAMATPLFQAAYVVRTYVLAMRLGVDRVDIMFATDTDNFNAGFFLHNGAWRPSAQAVRTLVKMMPNPKITKAVSDGLDGYYAYEFQANGLVDSNPPSLVTMAWNVAGPKTVELAVATSQVQVVDMLGYEKTVAAKDGKITVDVGPCPVYVRALGLK